MTHLCDIFTDEDEYEVFLENLLLRKGRYLLLRRNGQPREEVRRVPKRWVASKANILSLCGIEVEKATFRWYKSEV